MTPAERRAMLVAEIEDLSAILAAEGYLAEGVKGQPVPHPAERMRMAAFAELRQLERAMAGADDDVTDDLDAFLSTRKTFAPEAK